MIDAFLDGLIEILLYLPRAVFELIVDALVAAVNAISAPDTVANITGALSSLPSGVIWFLSIARLDFGLSVVFGALLARFILKRIPGIG